MIGSVNVKGVSQNDIEEVQQNIDNIKELIGQTANTGGTASAGTVMAKLNKLLTDWTSARASKIDTINTNAANLNTRLTSTRAGYLDLLNRGVSIKNIQRGFFFVNIKNIFIINYKRFTVTFLLLDHSESYLFPFTVWYVRILT